MRVEPIVPMRNDDDYSFVSCWGYMGPDQQPALHREPLEFEVVKPTRRSYK